MHGRRGTLQRNCWRAISTRLEARKEQKRAARLSAENTFEVVAREWCENQKDGWTARYHDHVVTRLEADVFPEIGSRPIAEIEPPELLAVLRKVEKRGALEIAKRLRQTVGQVFRYGIVTGTGEARPLGRPEGRAQGLRPASAPQGHAARRPAGIPAGACPATMARRERDWRYASRC